MKKNAYLRLRYTIGTLIILGLLIILSYHLVAPANANPGSAQSDSLTILTLWHSYGTEEQNGLWDVINSFEATHPEIQITTNAIGWDSLHNEYVEAAATGSGPALLIGAADWGIEFYESDLIADVSAFASQALLETINPMALLAVQYKEALLGLPESFKGVVLFRNTDIITDTQPTYTDLVTAAQDASQGDISGAVLERGFFYAAAHLHGLGGVLMDDQGCPAFNTDEGIEWLNLLDSFENAGPTLYYSDDDVNQFKDGKVGIIIDGTWNMGTISDTLGSNSIAIDSWPTPLSGYVQVENIYLNPDTTSEEQAAAWSFMEYMLSSDAQEIMSEEGHIPTVEGVLVTDPLVQQAMQNAFPGGVAIPILPQLAVYWPRMDTALTSVFDGEVEPDQALEQAEAEITVALRSMGTFCGNVIYLPMTMK